MRFLCSLMVLILLTPVPGMAEDLLMVYQFAQANDPSIQVAKASHAAAREAFPQARALFLPTLNAAINNTNYVKNYKAEAISVSDLNIPISTSKFRYHQNVYGLTLSQPIFYYQQWVQLAKADTTVKKANADYAIAEQDLIIRTIQRYLSVLSALDTLEFAMAQSEAFFKVLEQTRQRFKAGVVNTAADLQIAKARYDSSKAQEIAAKNNVEIQKKQLQEIIGKKTEKLSPLRGDLLLAPPMPEEMDAWVHKALEQNLELQAARYQVETSRTDIKLQQANHLPAISVDGSFTHSSSTKDLFAMPQNNTAYVGLQVSIPLFNGGSTLSKTRQARHIYEQTYRQMEVIHRQVESQASEAYLNVLTQISQIHALKQAVHSNQIAWEAASAAFKAGIRTVVDVLNAQSDLIKAKQDYANARYAYILQSLQLKKAAGILCPYDVAQINGWLSN